MFSPLHPWLTDMAVDLDRDASPEELRECMRMIAIVFFVLATAGTILAGLAVGASMYVCGAFFGLCSAALAWIGWIIWVHGASWFEDDDGPGNSPIPSPPSPDDGGLMIIPPGLWDWKDVEHGFQREFARQRKVLEPA